MVEWQEKGYFNWHDWFEAEKLGEMKANGELLDSSELASHSIKNAWIELLRVYAKYLDETNGRNSIIISYSGDGERNQVFYIGDAIQRITSMLMSAEKELEEKELAELARLKAKYESE